MKILLLKCMIFVLVFLWIFMLLIVLVFLLLEKFFRCCKYCNIMMFGVNEIFGKFTSIFNNIFLKNSLGINK